MTRQELIHKTLQECFSGECEIVGEPNVSNISSGTANLARTYGGSNIDISAIIELLANSVGFIDSVINIITFYKKEKNEMPTPIQINVTIETKMSLDESLTPEKRNEIYQFLLNELKKQDKSDEE